ncbi:hypothetical protein F2Q69_00060973 [Brassica cretica]|uniref:Uncharacterized protein n=1 Tax=Brassica cretica TaxID=69181 RepID=A0A8S9RP45_BRACR|nr:hypothetical protein F2Q69_00060973 [Brassica cretica]
MIFVRSSQKNVGLLLRFRTMSFMVANTGGTRTSTWIHLKYRRNFIPYDMLGRTVMFSGGCLLYPRRFWKGAAERRVANGPMTLRSGEKGSCRYRRGSHKYAPCAAKVREKYTSWTILSPACKALILDGMMGTSDGCDVLIELHKDTEKGWRVHSKKKSSSFRECSWRVCAIKKSSFDIGRKKLSSVGDAWITRNHYDTPLAHSRRAYFRTGSRSEA